MIDFTNDTNGGGSFSSASLALPTGTEALSDPVLYNYIKGLYDNGYTVLENNYTVTGSLTITNKGVASGFSGSNYITLDKFNPSSEWEFNISFILNSTPAQTQMIVGRANGGGCFRIAVSTELKPECGLSTSDSGWDIGEIKGTEPLELNTKYLAKVIYKDDVYIFYINDTLIGTITSHSHVSTGNNNLLLGAGYNLSRYLDSGSIYLNSLVIKENGIITKQGKYITSNITSSGLKVVDVTYQDVIDEIFNSAGSAPYFVIDTANETVTLPKGDLFGFITQALN